MSTTIPDTFTDSKAIINNLRSTLEITVSLTDRNELIIQGTNERRTVELQKDDNIYTIRYKHKGEIQRTVAGTKSKLQNETDAITKFLNGRQTAVCTDCRAIFSAANYELLLPYCPDCIETRIERSSNTVVLTQETILDIVDDIFNHPDARKRVKKAIANHIATRKPQPS